MSNETDADPVVQGNPLKQLWSKRRLISVRLYFAFACAVIITLTASLLAIVAINLLANAQSQVNEQNVPKLLGAFTAAQLSSELVSALPRMTASGTQEEFDSVAKDIENTTDAFAEDLRLLDEMYDDQQNIDLIQESGSKIQSNIDQVQELMIRRFELIDSSNSIIQEVQELNSRANHILVPAIDDQLFFAMTSYRQMEGESAERQPRINRIAVDEYRHLETIQRSIADANRALNAAHSTDHLHQIPPISQEFDAAINRINRSMSYVTEGPDHATLQDLIQKITNLGRAKNNSFSVRSAELELIDQLESLILENEQLVSALVSQIEELVNNAKLATDRSTKQSEEVAQLSEVVLIGYNILTITGAILIAWLWIGRQLIDRITRLSGSMRTMAGGNLEVEIDQSGHDEVAQMATALEVFRKHALEVQRLNLVEELANQLKDKNETLEKTNVALRAAQNQIVMREKLAALGELTAGVAHEIKNPMNFIINFSDVSAELIEELVEELDEASKGEKSGDGEESGNLDLDLIREICGDLSSNLERISSHGQRANRIVVDMLSMGRGSAEWRASDLNGLIDSHVKLAFHSQRGLDTDFQLKMDFNFDDSIPEINLIPQDFGRVVLNITTNACHATHEKRLKLQEEGTATDYMPTITITTRKTDAGYAVDFEDNGPGMTQETIEKIFQPFFTTKDPNSGTGLGMSLSHDIMRQHGGEIQVKSELGVGSTLTLTLPLDPAGAIELAEQQEDIESSPDVGN